MRRNGEFILVSALALLTGSVSAEDQVARNKSAAEALIRDMFSRKIRELERVLSRDVLPFAKRCEYVQGTFESRIIEENGGRCHPLWLTNFRFPSLSSEDLMYLDEAKQLPKYRIVNSRVTETTAVVTVQTPILEHRIPGRVVYYLRKTNERWKISNMLAYEHWPIDTNQEGGCRYVSGYYQFALPPKTEADLEDLPPLCKALELDNMRRSGSGSLQQKEN